MNDKIAEAIRAIEDNRDAVLRIHPECATPVVFASVQRSHASLIKTHIELLKQLDSLIEQRDP